MGNSSIAVTENLDAVPKGPLISMNLLKKKKRGKEVVNLSKEGKIRLTC